MVKQVMHTLIQNPFYYGVMRVKGKLYAHKYEPIITKDTFDRVQRVRERRSKRQAIKKSRYPFLFKGFFKCAITGKQITCDLKKGRYIYLISTNPLDTTKKIYVRQERVIAHIEKKLNAINITDEEFVMMKEYVQQSLRSEQANEQNNELSLLKEREDIEAQIDKLTDLLISDKINQFSYDRKHAQLQQRHSDISVALLENRSHDTMALENSIITMLYLCKIRWKSSKVRKRL